MSTLQFDNRMKEEKDINHIYIKNVETSYYRDALSRSYLLLSTTVSQVYQANYSSSNCIALFVSGPAIDCIMVVFIQVDYVIEVIW